MKTFKIATIAIVLTITAAMTTSNVQAQPQYKTRVRIVQPEVYPVPHQQRPMLGIHTKTYNYNGIHGALVTSDQKRRTLKLRLPCGNWQNVYFRTGYDIITQVNNRHVHDSRGIVNALNFGWNTVKVYDSYTQSWSTVKVHIKGHAPQPYPQPASPAFTNLAP